MGTKPRSADPVLFRSLSVLKEDLFGRVERGVAEVDGEEQEAILRDASCGALLLRPLARLLAARETAILRRLAGIDGVPRLIEARAGRVLRSFIPGLPLQEAQRPTASWFAEAEGILRELHARGITHNDLHKEPNLLVTPDGHAALVDFQIAFRHRFRGAWFRLCVDEDRRHLLKHKRRYAPELLDDEDRARLGRPSFVARWWRRSLKPLYTFVTRRLLRWRDGEGRGHPAEARD